MEARGLGKGEGHGADCIGDGHGKTKTGGGGQTWTDFVLSHLLDLPLDLSLKLGGSAVSAASNFEAPPPISSEGKDRGKGF